MTVYDISNVKIKTPLVLHTIFSTSSGYNTITPLVFAIINFHFLPLLKKKLLLTNQIVSWGTCCFFGLFQFQFQFTIKQQNTKHFKIMLCDGNQIAHTIEISITLFNL